jgi:hypothetical protein
MLLEKSKLSKVGSQEKFIFASQLTTSRKKNVVNRKCTPKGSLLKEVIEHIDLKLSENPTSSFKIPKIARHFLDIGKFCKLDLHCLSIDFKNKNPSSTPITEFLFIFSYDEGRTM